MAVKTYYVASTTTNNSGDLVDGTAQAAASRTDGWTVAKLAAAQMAEFDAATKQASGAFSSATKPASFITGTTCNAFGTAVPLTGTFAATSWVFTFAVRAVTLSAQAGRMRMRVFRSPNIDGSGATEITGATVVGTTSATLSTSADVTTVVTWTPGATVQLTNEYLFFVVAWEITTASGSNSSDVVIRTGSTGPAGSRLVTPDFVVPTPISIGKRAAATTVRGVTVTPGVVSISIGRETSSTLVYGVLLQGPVYVPISIGWVPPYGGYGGYGTGGYGEEPYGGQTVYGISIGVAYTISVGARTAVSTVRGITLRIQRTDISLPAILTMGASMSSRKIALRPIDASLVISPALLKRIPMRPAATLTLTPVVNRKLAKTLPVSLTLTPTQTIALPRRSQAISAILSLTPAVLVGRVKFQPLAGSLTLTPTLTFLSGKYRTFAVSPVLAPTMARFVQARRVYSVGLSLTPTLVDMLKKPFSVALPLPPTMVKAKVNFTTLSAPLSLSAVLTKVKAAPRAISGSLALTATLARRVWAPRSFSIGLSMAPTLLKRSKMFRQFDAGLNFIPTMKKARGFVFNTALNFEALLFKGNQFIPIHFASTFRFVVEMFPRRRSIGDYLLGSVLGTANLLNAKFTSVRLLAASMGRSSLSSSVAENDDGELVSASLGKSTLESVDK